MKKMGLNEIRKRFLDYFEAKGHLVEESYPLVPQKDKTLLLINAGMAPLKDYFSGADTPPSIRMATCQKCIRTGDIENVGHTSRHGTFFEMLGNFSFGDYFKEESLAWGWDFIINHLEMPLDKLWATVYFEDDEAYDIWKDQIKIAEDRIVRLGREDNFWEIGTGTGPCGPSSEIFYDRGIKYGCDNPDCKPGCECDRFVEFWNHVFTQFDKDKEGNYNKLPKPNIDTGMGLERVACLMQEVDSIFEIDTLRHILDKVVEVTGVEYGVDNSHDVSIRIITDHTRAVSFLVCDGVMPNNEGRGYVLRRLLRRAARHGKLLGVKGNFITDLVDEVIHVSGEAYPSLIEKRDYIKKVISIEEDRFQQTIDQGLEILMKNIDKIDGTIKQLDGKTAFMLYDTYGFPLELAQEILEEKGFTVNVDEFKTVMEEQKNRARSAREKSGDIGWEESVLTSIDTPIGSEFCGYKEIVGSGNILAIVSDNELVGEISTGSEAQIILDKTTFYPEGGGQAGDTGVLTTGEFTFEVTETKKGANDSILHIGTVKNGTIRLGEVLNTTVNKNVRKSSARNHTATHLLHKALKEVLGEHIAQAGSLVNESRMRFDFSHFEGITHENIKQIEDIVNEKIFDGILVQTELLSIDEAKKRGATALFGEKYGSEVRVVTIGDFSMELCGGTHVSNTGAISAFKIISESGIAAGVRRIEAITGSNVINYLNELEGKVQSVANILKTKVSDIEMKTESLVKELKLTQKDNEKMKNELASSGMGDILNKVININGIDVIAEKLSGVDTESLRILGDKIIEKLETGLVVLVSDNGEKVALVAMASKAAITKGIHAGNVIKEIAKITGGGGGGKPNMAQAGGKDASKINEALLRVKEMVESL